VTPLWRPLNTNAEINVTLDTESEQHRSRGKAGDQTGVERGVALDPNQPSPEQRQDQAELLKEKGENQKARAGAIAPIGRSSRDHG
jgi:hypothetical protein